MVCKPSPEGSVGRPGRSDGGEGRGRCEGKCAGEKSGRIRACRESEEEQKGSGKEDSSSQVGLREQASRGSEYRRPMPYRMEETTPVTGCNGNPGQARCACALGSRARLVAAPKRHRRVQAGGGGTLADPARGSAGGGAGR